MFPGNPSNYFVHNLLRARDWQHRPQFDQVCETKRIFTDEVYDLFSVHEEREFVSFVGVAGRCYLVVIRDLALKHIMILQSHAIQGQLMPNCDSFGLWENEWRCVSDQKVERFSPDRFEAVNRAFDEIEDFNYAFLLATKNRPRL